MTRVRPESLTLLSSLLLLSLYNVPLWQHIFSIVPANAGGLGMRLTFGVLIDANMLRNVAETDVNEVRDLLSFKLLLFILILGALPGFAMWRVYILRKTL